MISFRGIWFASLVIFWQSFEKFFSIFMFNFLHFIQFSSLKNNSLSDNFLDKRMQKVSHLQQHMIQAVLTANH